MIIQDELKDFLLNSFPDASIASGGKEILMRCQFCGDSHNKNSKGHFYISLGYDDEPIQFNCFKCHTSGLLTSKILKEIGIYDQELSVMISIYNSKFKNDIIRNTVAKTQKYYLNNNIITPGPLSEAKLGYINKRLGQNFNYSDLLQNKVVLNLSDLFKCNNLKNTRAADVMRDLDSSFIGFISQDNSYINMRNLRQGKVNKYIDTKYVNYKIFDTGLNKSYTIPATIKLSIAKRIKLHIAEGSFDILSIKYNLVKESTHNIYTSIGGSSYYDIIDYYVSTVGLLNLEVHVYYDNDQNINYISRGIRNMLKIYNIPLYIHNNAYLGEKDFGIPIDKIVDNCSLFL